MIFKEIAATKRSISSRKPVCGVGVNDATYLTNRRIGGKRFLCPYYRVWLNMLNRCYSASHQKAYACYSECSVSSEWLIFSSFKAWMKCQDWEGKELDKDLKCINNKEYSKDNCLFVDSFINSLVVKKQKYKAELPCGVAMVTGGSVNPYQSSLHFKGKRYYLGVFKTKEEASSAYVKLKIDKVLEVSGYKKYRGIKKYLVRYAKYLEDQCEA